MSQDKLTWLEVNVADLSADNQKLYKLLKDAQEKTAKLRSDFEAAVRKQAEKNVPEGHELVFSYRFGKLSVAASPKQEKARSSNKPTFKLG